MSVSDEISFGKEQLGEVAGGYSTASTSINNSMSSIISAMNTIKNNWSGDERDKAETDFASAQKAIEDLQSNLNTMNNILGEASSEFNKVKY